jgi:hypothetical protein
LPDSLIHGDYLLQLGVFYMATLSCRHDLWPEGKPLQVLMTTPVQLPWWRPSVGFSAACSGLSLPSGRVPGEKKDVHRCSPSHVGGEGSDCVPAFHHRSFLLVCSTML